MATRTGESDADKKIAAYSDFSAQLLRRIESGNVTTISIQELEHLLARKCPRPPASKAIEFDRLGTEVWNAAIRLKDQSSPMFQTWPHFESQIRVLAFFLLDTAQRSYVKHGSKKSSQNIVRVVRTALRAARICIGANALDLCISMFEQVANYVEHKQDPPSDFKKHKQENETEVMLKELTAEYYLLRAALSWKQNKLDTVTFCLSKVLPRPERSDMLHLAEKKADLTYEIGKSALKKKQFELAVHWLDQSRMIFDHIDPEMLSSDFCDLRLVVMLDLARALVGVGDVSSLEKAFNLVVMLEQEHGFKTEVHLLRLDVIFAQRPFQPEEFHGALIRIISVAIMSEGTFQAIMYQIRKLNTIDTGKPGVLHHTTVANTSPGPHSHLACQALDNLLSRLLADSQLKQTFVEKVLVTRIWTNSLSLQVQDHPAKLDALFEDIVNTNAFKLSPEATHASQSLIWKAVATLQQSQSAEAAQWCALALHEIFSNSGDVNKARLSRKMMMIALARGDMISAREAYHKMPETGKEAAMTKYLMYKIALQEKDQKLATESLEGVSKASAEKTDKFLYACALEAQQVGDRKQFIAAMNTVLEHCERTSSSEVRLPVLLRCIAGAINTELSNNDMPLDAALMELCKVYEAAMRHGSSFTDEGNDDTRQAELRWFACHSYNTSLKYCADMDPELLLRFMMASIALIDLLRSGGEEDDHLMSRLLLCRFLVTSALIVLARAEDSIERSLQLYLEVRRQIEAFLKEYQEALQTETLQSETKSDLEVKEFEMRQFDLEALMRLEHWNDLEKTLSMCLDPRHSNRLESAADLILHIHTHISASVQQHDRLLAKIPTVMEKIINICWRNNKDITRLARWIRCLFQMTLSTNPTISLRCLDQAHAIAGRAHNLGIPEPYPVDELEWLATTAFNQAVDLRFAGSELGTERESPKIWAEKALMLAGSVGGGLVLHKSLQDKWMQLSTMKD